RITRSRSASRTEMRKTARTAKISMRRVYTMRARRAVAAIIAIVAAHAGADTREPLVAGCGLAYPAFCEAFESGPAPLQDRGRGNELSRARFSTPRYTPSLSTRDGRTFWAWQGELGMMDGEADTCRSGLPELLLPSL